MPARYDATGQRGDGPALAASCRAWALTPVQAEAFFRHARPITPEAGHGFDTLPCTIAGRLRSEGREWAFEINGGATATWRSGNDQTLLGCSDPACAPLVLSMPLGED